MSGKLMKLYISSTGTSGGTMTEVELQGDMKVSTGKANVATVLKNGTISAQANSGFSASVTIAPKIPASTGQLLVKSASDNSGNAYIQVKHGSGTTGSERWVGDVILSITEVDLPNGVVMWNVEINENGTITNSVV